MKRLLLVLLLFSNIAFSQVIISSDTTVCGNFNDTLYALSAIQSSMQIDDQHDDVKNEAKGDVIVRHENVF